MSMFPLTRPGTEKDLDFKQFKFNMLYEMQCHIIIDEASLMQCHAFTTTTSFEFFGMHLILVILSLSKY